MMNKWPIALGSLTAAVVGVIAVLAVAGVLDGGSGGEPGDGDQADTSALCVEGAEDCEDTVVILVGDEDDVADAPPPGDGEPDLPISGDAGDTHEGAALAIEAAFAAVQAMGGPPASELDVIEVRAVDWPNACLGIDTPGVACTQVITPGYIVFLDAGWGPYTFHADTHGNVVLAGLPR